MSFRAIALLLCLLAGNAVADVRILGRDLSARSEGVVAADPAWSELVVCNGMGGFHEWRFHLPESGEWWLHARYAAGESRPVILSLDGTKREEPALARETGGFFQEQLDWETVGPITLEAGEHTLRAETAGFMPHLAGWVLSRSESGWDRKAFDAEFPDPRAAAQVRVAEIEERMASARAELRERTGLSEILFVKRITYTSDHYYTEYINSRWTPGGGICVLSLEDGSVRELTPGLASGVVGRIDLGFDARRIAFDWKAGPEEGYRLHEMAVDGTGIRRILEPPPDEADLVARYHLGYHHGTDDMHPCWLPDGDLAFISTRCQAGTLCDGSDNLTTTVLYRVGLDGERLRRLSFGALSEATPTMLPDGRILYTRWEYVDKGAVGAKCLWSMRPDGTASQEVYGNDIPFPPTMIQGRAVPGETNRYIALGCPHYPQNALGTVFEVDTSRPLRTEEAMAYLTPQVKVLAEGGWHFEDLAEPVEDGSGRGPLFRDPWPLGRGIVLVAHKPRDFGASYAPNGYGLYALYPGGRLEPLYHDPDISSWQPMPLAARPAPPVLSEARDGSLASRGLARVIVEDVHRGMKGVAPGTIRYLRVLEQMPRPWSARRAGDVFVDEYDQQHAVVSKDTALGLKVQHGIVPVEADGSASFLVPANASIFLQALDAHWLAVQTERTFVNYMPGETRTCVGCHETNSDASPPAPRAVPLALRRAPSLPGPQPGETDGRRPLDYVADVQPVLDRHCTSCHGAERKDGGLDLSGTLTRLFSASYENLLPERRGARADRVEPDLVPTIGENHPKTGHIGYLPARSLGSHNSVLMAMLMPEAIQLSGPPERLARAAHLAEVHRALRLAPEELLRISNWVDTNAQYYGSYFGTRNLALRESSDFRPPATWESARRR